MINTSLPLLFFFFNDTATTEIYTLSLHDALPLLHDHLGSRWLLHELRVRLDSGRTDRHLDRLAGAVLLRAARRLLDGRADLGDADSRRSLLVGSQARWQGLELVDGLVQHGRPC